MPRARKKHSAAFKAQVALEAIKQRKTTREIASTYQIHPVQVSQWKKQLLEHCEAAFAHGQPRREPQLAAQDELYAQIGRLQMELAWVKKKAERLD